MSDPAPRFHWLKRELAAHVQELHPHGQSVTPLDELRKWRADELLSLHIELHGRSPLRRNLRKEQPHGPEEAFGHD